MVRRYLDNYYVFDPFYASWRRERRLGIMPLKRARRRRGQARPVHSRVPGAVGNLRRGRHHAGGWRRLVPRHLSRPLDRDRSRTARSRCWTSGCRYSRPCMRSTSKRAGPSFSRTSAPTGPGASPRQEPTIPASLWPELCAARARTGAVDPRRPSDRATSPSGSASPSARSRTTAAASMKSSTSPPNGNCSCSSSSTGRTVRYRPQSCNCPAKSAGRP